MNCMHCTADLENGQEVAFRMCSECYEFFTGERMPDAHRIDSNSNPGDAVDNGVVSEGRVEGTVGRNSSRGFRPDIRFFTEVKECKEGWKASIPTDNPLKTKTIRGWELVAHLGYLQKEVMESLRTKE